VLESKKYTPEQKKRTINFIDRRMGELAVAALKGN
jgi:hypothetical protein